MNILKITRRWQVTGKSGPPVFVAILTMLIFASCDEYESTDSDESEFLDDGAILSDDQADNDVAGGDPDDNADISVPGDEYGLDSSVGFFSEYGLTCELSLDIENNMLITMTVKNNGIYNDVQILKRFNAWDDMENVLDIVSDSSRAIYAGLRAVRTEPTEDEFLDISANNKVSADYNIASHYQIDEPGNYSVSLHQKILAMRVDGKLVYLYHECPSLTTDYNKWEVPLAKFEYDNDCRSQQTGIIEASRAVSYRNAIFARDNALNSAYSGVNNYWFGEDWNNYFTDSGTLFIKYIADKVRKLLKPGDDFVKAYCQGFDDPCGGSTIAAYNAFRNNVYICDPFYSLVFEDAWLPNTSSQVGTVYHEMVHEYNDTDLCPERYGMAGAMYYAQNDTWCAVQHSNNHERWSQALWEHAHERVPAFIASMILGF